MDGVNDQTPEQPKSAAQRIADTLQSEGKRKGSGEWRIVDKRLPNGQTKRRRVRFEQLIELPKDDIIAACDEARQFLGDQPDKIVEDLHFGSTEAKGPLVTIKADDAFHLVEKASAHERPSRKRDGVPGRAAPGAREPDGDLSPRSGIGEPDGDTGQPAPAGE